MHYLKRIIGIISLLFAMMAFSAETPATTIITPPAKLQKIFVMLDWQPNADHAPLFVAQQQGFFANRGLELRLLDPLSAKVSKESRPTPDVMVMYQSQLLQDLNKNQSLTRIATLINAPLNCVIVREDSAYNSLRELRGKRIGYTNGRIDVPVLEAMLYAHGMNLKDVQLINLNGSLARALAMHAVDATVGTVRNFQLAEMQILKHPGRAFCPEQNGVPSYDQLILVVASDRVTDLRMKNFVLALQEGAQYLQAHPDAMWKRFAEIHPDIDNAAHRQQWMDSLPYFAKEPAMFSFERYEKFDEFIQDFSQKKGIAMALPPVITYAKDITLAQ